MFPILNPHSLLILSLWVIPVHQPQASITKYCYQIWDLRLDLKLSDFWLVSIWATTHLCFMYLLVQLVMSRECMFLGSLSRHNKDLEWQTLKPPRHVTALGSWIDRVIALRSRKDHVIALRQISVTALFYLEDSRKIHLWGMRARWSKDTKRRELQHARMRERALWLLFLYVFLSLGLSYINWASQECCLFYLRSSLQSSDLPLFYSCRLFPSLSFSHCHFGLLFPILPTDSYKKS